MKAPHKLAIEKVTDFLLVCAIFAAGMMITLMQARIRPLDYNYPPIAIDMFLHIAGFFLSFYGISLLGAQIVAWVRRRPINLFWEKGAVKAKAIGSAFFLLITISCAFRTW